jgi:hypothetical protein
MRHSLKSVYCALVSVYGRSQHQRVSNSDRSLKRERSQSMERVPLESPGRRFLQDLQAIVGKLLAKQDGCVLREGIRALSEDLTEMEV